MMMTKQERIDMVKFNIEESRLRMEAGKISAQQFARLNKDGKACIAEINARPASDFKSSK